MLLGLNMPGIELAGKLRALYPDTPIAILTANIQGQDLTELRWPSNLSSCRRPRPPASRRPKSPPKKRRRSVVLVITRVTRIRGIASPRA